MPIVVSTFLIPPPGSPLFVVEDVNLRGGLMVVKDADALNAVSPLKKKPGMVVIQADIGKWWQLGSDNAWYEVTFGTNLIPVPPINIGVDDTLYIDEERILPEGGSPGDALLYTLTGPAWGTANTGGDSSGAVRSSAQYTVPVTLNPGESHDFSLVMAKTLMLLECSLDVPCKVEAFADINREEANPYVFIADNTRLYDDGTSRLQDGSLYYGRRYSFLANLEDPVNSNIYWRITNTQSAPATPTLSLNFLILE